MDVLKMLYLQIKDLLLKFVSRKLFVSLIAILSIGIMTEKVIKLAPPEHVMLVVIPFMITGVTIVCVTYVTGLAKIDIQASVQTKL